MAECNVEACTSTESEEIVVTRDVMYGFGTKPTACESRELQSFGRASP